MVNACDSISLGRARPEIESETAEILLIRGLFRLFLILLNRVAFCGVLDSVRKAKLPLSVKIERMHG